MESDSEGLDEDVMCSNHSVSPQKVQKKSLRKAINAHCKDCIYDEHAKGGQWRQQVQDCTVTKCALYDVRPMSFKVVEDVCG